MSAVQHTACPGCGTALVNSGPPIGEDFCPNKNCTWDRDKFWAGFAERARAAKARDRVRDAAPGLLEANIAAEQCIADFIEVYTRGASMVVLDEAVKSLKNDALKAVRAAIAKAEGRQP